MQRFLQNSPAPFRPQFLFFSFPEKTCVFSVHHLIIFCFFGNFFSFFVLAGFSYFFLDIFPIWWYNNIRKFTESHKSDAVIAQLVEHFLGKEEVTSSNLVNSSRNRTQFQLKLCAFWFPVFFQRAVPCTSLLTGTGDAVLLFYSECLRITVPLLPDCRGTALSLGLSNFHLPCRCSGRCKHRTSG